MVISQKSLAHKAQTPVNYANNTILQTKGQAITFKNKINNDQFSDSCSESNSNSDENDSENELDEVNLKEGSKKNKRKKKVLKGIKKSKVYRTLPKVNTNFQENEI